MDKGKDPIAQPLACTVQLHIGQLEFCVPASPEAAILKFDFEMTTLKGSIPYIFTGTESYHKEC